MPDPTPDLMAALRASIPRRLSRALSYLDRTEGRTAEDQDRIGFAREEIGAVLRPLAAVTTAHIGETPMSAADYETEHGYNYGPKALPATEPPPAPPLPAVQVPDMTAAQKIRSKALYTAVLWYATGDTNLDALFTTAEQFADYITDGTAALAARGRLRA